MYHLLFYLFIYYFNLFKFKTGLSSFINMLKKFNIYKTLFAYTVTTSLCTPVSHIHLHTVTKKKKNETQHTVGLMTPIHTVGILFSQIKLGTALRQLAVNVL